MEQTHGRIGMSFTPYGPYRMPRPLYEYGLNEFNQQGGCPAGHTCNGNMDSDVDALWRADAGREHHAQFDLVLRIYAGYDETTDLAGVRRDEVRDQGRRPGRVGPAGPAAARTGSPTATCRGPRGARARSSGASPRSARARARARSRTRSSTRSACPTTTTTRTSTPYHRVGTGPWDILDRGSFNGPGGPHKRWLVPVTQGGAMEAGMTLRTKLSRTTGSRRPTSTASRAAAWPPPACR